MMTYRYFLSILVMILYKFVFYWLIVTKSSTRVFNYISYRDFINAWLFEQPRHGHGQLIKIAHHLRVHTTLISQIMCGRRELALEHAAKLASFFELDTVESDYFITLAQLSLAGNDILKASFTRRLDDLRARGNSVKSRIGKSAILSEADQGRYYSDWHYSAVRMIASCKDMDNAESIAAALDLPKTTVESVLAFLINKGLLKEGSKGFQLGPSKIHVSKESAYSASHHRNWRLQAMQRYSRLDNSDFVFTAPMVLSKKDFLAIGGLIGNLIEEIGGRVETSPSEVFALLNIDWLRVVK